jgi:hypothetical protein
MERTELDSRSSSGRLLALWTAALLTVSGDVG